MAEVTFGGAFLKIGGAGSDFSTVVVAGVGNGSVGEEDCCRSNECG